MCCFIRYSKLLVLCFKLEECLLSLYWKRERERIAKKRSFYCSNKKEVRAGSRQDTIKEYFYETIIWTIMFSHSSPSDIVNRSDSSFSNVLKPLTSNKSYFTASLSQFMKVHIVMLKQTPIIDLL